MSGALIAAPTIFAPFSGFGRSSATGLLKQWGNLLPGFMSMALLGTGREKGVDVDFFKGVLKALMYVRVDTG